MPCRIAVAPQNVDKSGSDAAHEEEFTRILRANGRSTDRLGKRRRRIGRYEDPALWKRIRVRRN
jgi:hypothetical protein